jgi:hypothetical protein
MHMLDPALEDGIYPWRDGCSIEKRGGAIMLAGTETLAGGTSVLPPSSLPPLLFSPISLFPLPYFPISLSPYPLSYPSLLYLRRVCILIMGDSILPLDQAVRNLVKYAHITLEKALVCATYNPARVVGGKVWETKGGLEVGMHGDVCIWDEGGNVRGVWKGGIAVFCEA